MRYIHLSVAAVALAMAAPVAAQSYPSKIVRILVPTAPGNAADITTRLVTERLSKRFGQPVIVENRPGGAATGSIAAVATAQAAPDGHTLLMTSTSFAINTAMFSKLPYDVEKDFEAVALTGQVGMVLLAAPDSPVTTVKELVETIRKDPGKYNYAIVGRGSIQHLTMELFLSAIGAQMEPVPYKGSAPAMVDVIASRVPFMFDALSSATTYVTTGRVKALAVGSPKRFAALPNVPSTAESGIPELANFEVIGWVGLVAPKGTPKPIVDLLNQHVLEIVQEKEIKEKLGAQGLEIPGPHPAEKFRDFLREDVKKWDRAARAAKIPRQEL
jgi:tripartite-type tricarboxylate transporter receptor subunit TctC